MAGGYKPTSSEEPSQEENIASQKLEKKSKNGCLWGCIGLPALAIASAIFIPSFLWKPPLHLSVYFDTLEYGIDECLRRARNGETTTFLSSNYFKNRSKKSYHNWRFKIIQSKDKRLGGNTCLAARAIPIHHRSDTWFEIKYDFENGKLIKICGDSKKFGCQENNIWTTSESLGPKGWN